ncbi:hypothetical protein SRHO_G00203450 [Serrasalmus rhombeus]
MLGCHAAEGDSTLCSTFSECHYSAISHRRPHALHTPPLGLKNRLHSHQGLQAHPLRVVQSTPLPEGTL